MGLINLPEELLQRLAKDVEYRIYQVVEVCALSSTYATQRSQLFKSFIVSWAFCLYRFLRKLCLDERRRRLPALPDTPNGLLCPLRTLI